MLVPLSKGFTTEKREALRKLSEEFDEKFRAILINSGHGKLLETQWVDNDNWAGVFMDMVLYQNLLKTNSAFKKAILQHTMSTIHQTKEILGL